MIPAILLYHQDNFIFNNLYTYKDTQLYTFYPDKQTKSVQF